MSSSLFKITTHVLDTSKGLPVSDLPVKLLKLKNSNEWILISDGKTCSSGRCSNLIADVAEFSRGTYKLNFHVKDYYESINVKSMYPMIDVIFDVDKSEHYHMPLLLNAYGFTTYRGT